jgi:phage gpG-like protein
MNHEPVAHFYPEGEGCTVYDIQFAWKVTGTTEPIPLYTHPAKELDGQFKKGFEAGKEEGWKAHKFHHPAKTLTDEEILEFRDKVPYTLGSDLIDFARAILKKAQEK